MVLLRKAMNQDGAPSTIVELEAYIGSRFKKQCCGHNVHSRSAFIESSHGQSLTVPPLYSAHHCVEPEPDPGTNMFHISILDPSVTHIGVVAASLPEPTGPPVSYGPVDAGVVAASLPEPTGPLVAPDSPVLHSAAMHLLGNPMRLSIRSLNGDLLWAGCVHEGTRPAEWKAELSSWAFLGIPHEVL